MTSINPHYTFEYSQPSDYHFSHDSVFLARDIFDRHRHDIQSDWQVLDLCAGCGIVGMDFLFHCRQEQVPLPQHMDFLEVQEVYRPHFGDNARRLNIHQTKLEFLLQNYNQPLNRKYDLIISNPPYFDPKSGTLSPSAFKNRCRFFIDASSEDLLDCVANCLKPTGVAYLLLRDPTIAAHKKLHIEIIGDIRKTPLARCRLASLHSPK